MRVFLERKNIKLSALTVHKYMNKELKLYSIVRRKNLFMKKEILIKYLKILLIVILKLKK